MTTPLEARVARLERSARLWRGVALLLPGVIGAGVLAAAQRAGRGKAAAPEGFSIAEVRFDESDGRKQPTPVIPSGWRLISVSNGEAENSNNLWFQNEVGRIYMVQGFTESRKFILDPSIQLIESEDAPR